MARLSMRTGDLHASPVRDMLNVAMRPEVISFAGGLPAAETFAGLDVPTAPRELLQYGPTEGEPELRARIAEELSGLGIDASPERVLVLSGSQQGIDLAAKLVVDAGAGVAVEEPAYLAALQVFRFFGAQFSGLDRADPARGWDQAPPRLAYVTPTFQNPTGICWTAEERQALAGACDRHDVILFEDDPYRDLAYEACERRPAVASCERASWIYQGSFSKTVAPGLRLGFLAASEDLFTYLVRLKQAADLHTNRLSQWMVLQYLNAPDRAQRMGRVTAFYRERRDTFDRALHRHLGGLADWTAPAGGLFFWVTLRGGIDAQALLNKALERNVLFTPGGHFMAQGGASASIRLNFSLAAPDDAERGLRILGELLREAAA
ncbi:PLP-dependent aminotransferase family protein [Phenylobacterium sp. LjRoot225]|uniref:aminotransferase-like domain-containing protein n=1 Tax=Phenylobacterium sp. LjRoot225 TaxID=3342285 RepID=UPI003ED08287